MIYHDVTNEYAFFLFLFLFTDELDEPRYDADCPL